MNIKDKVANRIQSSRNDAKMTQAELATACGVSRGRLSNWEGGTRMPNPGEIHKLASVLKVSPSWLMGMVDDVTQYDIPNGKLLLIPVISLDDAGNEKNIFNLFNASAKESSPFNVSRLIGWSANEGIGERVFAVSIADQSMSPDLTDGDIAIIALDVAAKPGNYVLAVNRNDGKAYIRKLRMPDNQHYEFVSLNPDWPNYKIKVDDPSFLVIGKVIELRREFI